MADPEDIPQKPEKTRLSFARRRPAIVALAAVALGIFTGQTELFSHWWWLAPAAVAFVFAGVFAKRSVALAGVFVLVAALSLSAFRAGLQTHGNGGSHVSALAGDSNKYTLYVTVNDWPDVREHRTLLTVDVDSVKALRGAVEYHGGLLINIAVATTEFQYGDRLIVTGEIRRPPRRLNPGGFDYARFLRWRDVYGIVYLPHPYGIQRNPVSARSLTSRVEAIRAFILGVFHRTLEDEQAALASGFLIGETSGISDNVYNQFRNSGTLHLLAVSGSNVAIVLLTLRLLLWPFPISRRTMYVLMILAAVLFCFVSHTQPSVIRATVMVVLYLIGRILQRPIDYHNIIASAGLLILLWEPRQLFDVGFQLSFVVAWAIILAMDVINHLGAAHRKKRWFKYLLVPLGVSFAAQVAATPITLYYFGTAPAWSTAANMIIGPIVSLVVGVSIVALVVSAILPQLADFLGGLLNVGLTGVLQVLEFFGGPHAPQLRVSGLSPWVAVGSLGLVFLGGAATLSQRSRRALIWGLALTPTLAGGWTLAQGLSERSSARFFSARGGVYSIVDTEPPVVILSDLRGEPTDIFTYDLRPQIERFVSADSFRIVALSGDYATVESALITLDSIPEGRLIVTSLARGLIHDRSAGKPLPLDSSRIQFAGRLVSPETKTSEPALVVGQDFAFLRWRGERFLYLSEVSKGEGIPEKLFGSGGRLWIVCSNATAPVFSSHSVLAGRGDVRFVFQRRTSSVEIEQQFNDNTVYLNESGALEIVAPGSN